MKKSVKILSAVLAVVLVFSCGVGATLAYLHKETEKAVINTFSAKDLLKDKDDFQIWEHDVVRNEQTGAHEYKETKGEATEVKEITYDRVTPGEELPKDPFVRVTNIENAYLFIEIVDALAPKMTYDRDASWEPLMRDTAQVEGTHGGKIFVKKVSDPAFPDNEYILPARESKIEYNILSSNFIHVGTDFDPATAPVGNAVTLTFWGYLTQADATLNTPLKSWDAAYPAAAA